MIEVWIDDQRCDVDKLPTIPIDFSLDKLTKAEGCRSGRVIEFDLPATPSNEVLFASSHDIYAATRFNAQHHTAVVKRDGVEIFKGTVYLLATTLCGEAGGSYKIRVSEGGAEWIEPVVYGKLSDLDIPFAADLNLTTISNSWMGEEAVRFLPVRRGDKRAGFSPSVNPIEWVLLTDDYHPFISISAMVKAMFARLGYTLRSNFFDSKFGRSLYMSGDYKRQDLTEAKQMCDFLARRSTPVTATADAIGRVYASKSFALHSLGPLVDTADPSALDSNGEPMIDTFNTLNAFSKSEYGDICFKPPCSVNVGFIAHLEYTTDYKILSRERLRGFNIVEGIGGVRVEYPLVNTLQDLRNDLSANWEYRAIVFDHTEGCQYKLMATAEDGVTSTLAQWSSRSELIYTSDSRPNSVDLLSRRGEADDWVVYEGDWALYAGYVDEVGTMDVELDLRLPPIEVSAGENYLLDKFWFAGAEPQMTLTLGTGTTLRPYFTSVPGYGSSLLYEDIAPRDVNQVALLDALGDMFNLAFYTDRVTREVFIEPLEDMYAEAEVVDINDRIDLSRAIELSDAGLDTPQTHKFAYIDSDRASHLFNLENRTVLGSWSFRNHLYGTKDSTHLRGNKLFTTTVNAENIIGYAPSVSLMQVGDVGVRDMGIDSGFTPHIVCYKGMRELPSNECWIANRRYGSYPYAAFVDGADVNLGYEERNGIAGLGEYHRARLVRQEEAQRVSLNIRFTTAEMAHLLTQSGPKISVLNRFRFDVGGQSSIYRIVEMGDWDTECGTIRCTFERELKD